MEQKELTSNFIDSKRQSVETKQLTEDGRYKRRIRSFVLRTGRLSENQKRKMQEYWSDFGLDFQQELFDFKKIFGNENPVVLEIGFGMGQSLVQMAKENPHLNYLGIEVHTPGVGACISSAVEAGVKNLKVICHDGVEILDFCIPDESLQGFQLFFPDPWHKAKHHKRRIVQPEFIQKILSKITSGGFVHLATDWENYSEQMLDVLQGFDNLENTSKTNDFIERPDFRPLTKFEKRGLGLGHGVWDLYFIKK